jgi:hypothetical protein
VGTPDNGEYYPSFEERKKFAEALMTQMSRAQ